MSLADEAAVSGTEAPEPAAKPAKVASRPGSQWATGKRRAGKAKGERKGYARGARTRG